MSSGQGAIPNWWYSPQAQKRMIWCNSKTNSIVWIKEDDIGFSKQLYNVLRSINFFSTQKAFPFRCYFLRNGGNSYEQQN